MTTEKDAVSEMRMALEGLLGDYKGSWFAKHGGETDFEKLPRVIRARKALADLPPASPGAGDDRVEWKCYCCHQVFTASQRERTDDGTGNGGAKCPYCKAEGQFTYRYQTHVGDPCKRCGTAHDDVAPGPCPASDPAPAAAVADAERAVIDAAVAWTDGVSRESGLRQLDKLTDALDALDTARALASSAQKDGAK